MLTACSCCLRGSLPAQPSQRVCLWVPGTNVHVRGFSQRLVTRTPVWVTFTAGGWAKEQRQEALLRGKPSSSTNTTTDMNEAHSCPGNCSAQHIIDTPLPFPASCSYSHGGVSTHVPEGKAHFTHLFRMMHLIISQRCTSAFSVMFLVGDQWQVINTSKGAHHHVSTSN